MRKIYILCVEDEPEVLDAIVHDLASLESMFPIETARSVPEARDVLARISEAKDRLGLAICDHIMPGENGVGFLIELYRNPESASARKILLTGQAGLDATVKAINFARLDYFIGKPWTKTELMEAVKAQLTAYVLEHEDDLHPYAGLLGERNLAEAMMKKLPDNR